MVDSGWAVFLGAVIGLLGSAVVPWIRDAAAAKKQEALAREDRRRDALIHLLSVNSAVGLAAITKKWDSLHELLERRMTAVARLLLELDDTDLPPLRRLLTRALPYTDDGEAEGAVASINALQQVLTDWTHGSLPSEDVEKTYDQLVSGAKFREDPKPTD